MVDVYSFLKILAFPVITLLLWTFLFNSKNSRFTKFVVEGGYVLFVIPIMVVTFLAIPLVAIGFWMNTTEMTQEIVQFFTGLVIVITIIVEYYYIKQVVKKIEEKEQMGIIDILKRELNPEYRKQRKVKQASRAEESDNYFSEISKMNDKKRMLELEKKEKLKRALLNEFE